MTFDDLLDHAAYDAGDDSSEYRTAALRWLNMSRAYISRSGQWRLAFRESVSVSTVADTPTVALVDTDEIEAVYGPYIYNTTNDDIIQYDTHTAIRQTDPNREDTGPPTMWSDAGANSSGQRLIALFPVPDAVYTLNFSGFLRLTDIGSGSTTLSEDPYFGPINLWASTMLAGVRYYHNLNNNEDAEQIMMSQRMFENEIRRQKTANSVAPSAVTRGRNNKSKSYSIPQGRLDPAHFRNG